MDFGTIKSLVRDYVIDLPDETDALVGAWVNAAYREAQDLYAWSDMESTLNLQTEEGERVLASIPENWKFPRNNPWLLEGDGGSTEIHWAVSKSEMIRRYPEDDETSGGSPAFVLLDDGDITVYPLPDNNSLHDDGDYRVKVPYYAYNGDMVSDSEANFITEKSPWFLIFKAAAEGMIFNREEERAQIYLTRAQTELQRVVRVDKRFRIPSSVTLRPSSDARSGPLRSRL